jgi:hypothetical protein
MHPFTAGVIRVAWITDYYVTAINADFANSPPLFMFLFFVRHHIAPN